MGLLEEGGEDREEIAAGRSEMLPQCPGPLHTPDPSCPKSLSLPGPKTGWSEGWGRTEVQGFHILPYRLLHGPDPSCTSPLPGFASRVPAVRPQDGHSSGIGQYNRMGRGPRNSVMLGPPCLQPLRHSFSCLFPPPCNYCRA